MRAGAGAGAGGASPAGGGGAPHALNATSRYALRTVRNPAASCVPIDIVAADRYSLTLGNARTAGAGSDAAVNSSASSAIDAWRKVSTSSA